VQLTYYYERSIWIHEYLLFQTLTSQPDSKTGQAYYSTDKTEVQDVKPKTELQPMCLAFQPNASGKRISFTIPSIREIPS
jgi:hypothetical protein